MATIYTIHRLYGERVLSPLVLLAAIYLTIAWKPGDSRNLVARLLPMLIGIQVLLGILWWLYLLSTGATIYLSFPFILHPILGLFAAAFAQLAFGRRQLFARLGRWAPLAALAVLFIIISANIVIARLAI